MTGPPPPQNYRLADRIGHRLSRTAALMHRYFDERLAPLGLSRMTWTLLASIGLEGVASPSELARHTGMTRPAVSRLLRDLERRGMLLREADGEDGRGRRLRLTPAGEALLEKAWPEAAATNSRFAAKLSEAERAQLFDLLDKLAAGEPGGVKRL